MNRSASAKMVDAGVGAPIAALTRAVRPGAVPDAKRKARVGECSNG